MSEQFILVQITDCHLFTDESGMHHGVNVYQNLINVLDKIKQLEQVDVIVFTGDLTQDHSEESYQLFVQAFKECAITLPVYYLAGNHDEPALLARYLVSPPFCQKQVIETPHWQILLMASKSETPSGKISQQELDKASQRLNGKKSQLLFIHHHPVDVGFFIDQHGLVNKKQLQEFIEQKESIVAVACGHVHQALNLSMTLKEKKVPLYTCPATSIQFDATSDTAKSNGQGAGFRLFTLKENKQFSTEVFFV